MNRTHVERYLSGRGVGRTMYGAVSIAFVSTLFAVATFPVSELPSIGGGSPSVAHGINDRGDVVGQSYTSLNENHSTVWPSGGAPRDLGTLGGAESWAAAISPSGVIIGMSGRPDITNHAALWASASSAPIDLGTLGGANSQADGVNANGDAVGYSWMPGDNVTLHAALWPAANHVAVDLGMLPGGDYSRAYAINASGDIVGTSDDAQFIAHPTLWPAAGRVPVVLQALGGGMFGGEAFAINDKGDIVGTSQNATGRNRATLWPAAGRVPVDLGTLGGNNYSAAQGINASGDIVGYSNTLGDLAAHATLWRAAAAASGSGCKSSSRSRADRDDRSRVDRDRRRMGSVSVSTSASAARTPIDLGVLPGGSSSQATGINASGQVIGSGDNVSHEQRAMSWNVGSALPPTVTPSNGHDGDHRNNGNHQNHGEEKGDC